MKCCIEIDACCYQYLSIMFARINIPSTVHRGSDMSQFVFPQYDFHQWRVQARDLGIYP